jgi:hypothetical protein
VTILGEYRSATGDYQRIVMAAKEAGSVGELVARIEAAAVEKVLAKLPAKYSTLRGVGLFVGAGLVAGGQKVYTAVLGRRAKRAAIIAEDELAAPELEAIIGGPETDDSQIERD